MSVIVGLSGEITALSSRSWDGWKYGTLQSGSRFYPISGHLEEFRVGDVVDLTGQWKEHPKYGRQFAVSTVIRSAPTGNAANEKWMIDRLPQIGPQRVKALVETFGEELWDVIEFEPVRLAAISGITLERAEEIRTAYIKFKEEREYYVTCYNCGFTATEVHRLRRSGIVLDDFINEVFALYFVEGVNLSYDRLDAIRAAKAQSRTSENRLVASVVEAMRRRAQEGDTAVDPFEAVNLVLGLADIKYQEAVSAVEQAILLQQVVLYRDHIQLAGLARAEQSIADKLINLSRDDNDDRIGSDARDSGSDVGEQS